MRVLRRCLLAALAVLQFGICAAQGRAAASDGPIDGTITRGSLPLRDSIVRDLHGVVLIEPKILGGRDATPGDDPWQVALIRTYKTGADRRPFCGASLVSATWVVTAAHCVDNGTRPSDFFVLAGTTDVAVGGVRLDPVEIIVHPGYAPGKRPRNDIALIRLPSPVPSAGIAPIATLLPDREAVALRAAGPVRVTGWGAVGHGGTAVRELRYVGVQVYSNDDCNDPVAYAGAVMPEMVCAGYAEGGKDSCQGDSGGPLTAVDQGQRVLVGIVSWGEGCGRPNRYGVYARVAHFAAWIEDCRTQATSCRKPSAAVTVGSIARSAIIQGVPL
jgi:secreted trypsin-like serine protease